jgi:hypothetical protein
VFDPLLADLDDHAVLFKDPLESEQLGQRQQLVKVICALSGEGHRFLKKSVGVLRGEPSTVEKYAPVATECASTAISRMATPLGVSASGYHRHLKSTVTTELALQRQRREKLAVRTASIHEDSHGVYGSPRITAELRARGEFVTEKTVAKIMAERAWPAWGVRWPTTCVPI